MVHFCEVVAAADGVTDFVAPGLPDPVETDGEIGEAAGELPDELPLGLDPTGVDFTAGVVSASVSVTGCTAVETAKVEVTTRVESAGQSVTVAAQLVTVITLVA